MANILITINLMQPVSALQADLTTLTSTLVQMHLSTQLNCSGLIAQKIICPIFSKSITQQLFLVLPCLPPFTLR